MSQRMPKPYEIWKYEWSGGGYPGGSSPNYDLYFIYAVGPGEHDLVGQEAVDMFHYTGQATMDDVQESAWTRNYPLSNFRTSPDWHFARSEEWRSIGATIVKGDAICPRCDERPKDGDDYLCHECRFGA